MAATRHYEAMEQDASTPYFVAIHRFELDPTTGDLTLWMLGGDGMHYAQTLSAGTLPALLATIIGLGERIRQAAPVATGQWENLQAVTAQAIRAIDHPASGLVGLELTTAEGLPLSLLFDRSALPRLRASLDALDGKA